MSRITCVVCWLHPDVTGDKIQDVAVIYDGNGYCVEHWKQALSKLRDLLAKAGSGHAPLNFSLPLLLAGMARETP